MTQQGRPAVFAELDLDAALARAQADHKLLVVDATAKWCGPCRIMDRTTWVEASVVAWLTARAIAIQIDVDGQPDVARRLRVDAMPTIIAFASGAEVDRVVGAKDPAELIAWLDAVARGETALDTKRAEVAAAPTDIEARCELAQLLVGAERLEEATAEYVWLWKHMLEHEPAMYGVRLSFFLAELAQLIACHPPARAELAKLRDQVAPPAERAPDAAAFTDWVALNALLGDATATVAWFDTTGATLARDARLLALLERNVVPLLVAAGRWADAGVLYADPLRSLARDAELRDHLDSHAPDGVLPEVRDRLLAMADRQFRDSAVTLVRALRAAGRTADADAVALEAQRIDPSDALAEELARFD
ncbi:MAG: thioredoxin family protein [Acidobacteriota bacterium]